MAERSGIASPLDRYMVQGFLAEGGMGAIYLGKKLGAGGFEKEVVLKQLLPEFTEQPEFIDLFLREARLSATLDHANIVHTIDLVRAGHEYFIVMEYVRGGDLRTLLKRAKRRRKRLHYAAALFIAREVLSALSYAHQKYGQDGRPLGLIHRDVSPANILVSGNGEVKLTDFGIAKASTHRSVFYKVRGKVGYMSPEQARSEPLDPRSDLYSLAICLYEMLTGERLFVASSLMVSADELYRQPIAPVSQKCSGLPKELDQIMGRALSLDRDKRFQTAGELQEALLRTAHRNGLLMSAGELASHMVVTCGQVEDWGSSVVRDPGREPSGTACFVQDPGTEKLRLPLLDDELDSVAEEISCEYLVEHVEEEAESHAVTGPRLAHDHALTFDPQGKRRPVADITRLTGLELTSIIRAHELTDVGARPLHQFEPPEPARTPAGPSPPTPSVRTPGRTDRDRGMSTDRVETLDPKEGVPLWGAIAVLALAFVGLSLAVGFTGKDLSPAAPHVQGLQGEDTERDASPEDVLK
ncbi:MAG: serine/threonine protein kinase [Deltaproteobacteria bacterium]|nr:serine/threonine protein kinase [Deltaproteobacteria bacterium]